MNIFVKELSILRSMLLFNHIYVSLIQFTSSQSVSPSSILILNLCASVILSIDLFQLNFCEHILFSHECYMSSTSHPPLLNRSNKLCKEILDCLSKRDLTC
jgi:hypothetical protein